MAVPRLPPSSRARKVPVSLFLFGLFVSNFLVVRFSLYGGPSPPKTSLVPSDNDQPLEHKSMGPVSYELARKHSYGFFQDIPDEEWQKFHQEFTQKRIGKQHYVNQTHPNDRSDKPAWWIFQNWDAYFNCPHLKKVGGLGDGPKFTCDPERIRTADRRSVVETKDIPQSSGCLIYSFGCNGNYRFEDGAYDQGIYRRHRMFVARTVHTLLSVSLGLVVETCQVCTIY